jgi:hypothetical protein
VILRAQPQQAGLTPVHAREHVPSLDTQYLAAPPEEDPAPVQTYRRLPRRAELVLETGEIPTGIKI